MSTGIIETIKIAALEAVENSKPCDIRFGTVSSISPLKVKVSNDFIIPESLLVVPEHLTDYSRITNIGRTSGGNSSESGSSITMTVEGETLIVRTNVAVVDEIEPDVTTEVVEEVNERTLTVYNSLAVGDRVILLRNQGGSSYLILDRI